VSKNVIQIQNRDPVDALEMQKGSGWVSEFCIDFETQKKLWVKSGVIISDSYLRFPGLRPLDICFQFDSKFVFSVCF
jgi:hypothetical protein